MISKRQQEILEFIRMNPMLSSSEINNNIGFTMSSATLKRDISDLVALGFISILGKGKGSKYIISDSYKLLFPINLDEYFSKEVDEREINESFNFEFFQQLKEINIFSKDELSSLDNLHSKFIKNISDLNEVQYQKEMERLGIDLSWKSSQIEGNTYSLLETERLLKEKETASGKTKDEAVMLLNHKSALDFILENKDYLSPMSLSKIEDVHSLLVKELNVDRNIRNKRVGITGTNYKPLDNEFQIKEVMISMCELVNSKDNVFERALIILVLISYIQPFFDGNKRTARIVSNAELISKGYCPLSFRSVDSIDYKKAMLVFYEQNNLYPFKKIFMEQYEFAVNTYF